MLHFRLLKNHAGLLLMGDYATLRALYGVIHDVNDRSPLIADVEGPFLGLAYDVRKAFQGERKVIKPPEELKGELGPVFGVQILWPVLLAQAKMFRESLAYIDHGKQHQALVYALESVIEQGLEADFPSEAADIKKILSELSAAHPSLMGLLNSRGAVFSRWTKTERRQGIKGLLQSFSPMYPFEYGIAQKQGTTHALVSPDEFVAAESEEWVDPKW